MDSAERIAELVADFTPDRVAAHCGIDRATIVRIARELCAAESAACYGRLGTTCQRFGTVASWAVDLVNIFSGNLDRPGGVMFPHPAAGMGAARRHPRARGVRLARWTSRVGGLPEMFGELPMVAMADEILTPGEGQVRAMITMAGNPLRSAPNSDRLAEALESLDFMVSIDIYRNETTRYADIILPPPSPLERDGYDLAFYRLSIRDVAKYSPAALPKPDDQPDEWEIILTLTKGLMGQKELPLDAADEYVIRQLVGKELGSDPAECRWDGLTADEVMAGLSGRRGPARVLDLLLRLGPYGDGFGRVADGLSLAVLENNPHGVDLGALRPGLPEILRTPGHRIELAPELIVGDLDRLRASL
ncbi:MAG: molybdopterin-dependent oxidoreductase, partial [Myxococcota bacterium]